MARDAVAAALRACPGASGYLEAIALGEQTPKIADFQRLGVPEEHIHALMEALCLSCPRGRRETRELFDESLTTPLLNPLVHGSDCVSNAHPRPSAPPLDAGQNSATQSSASRVTAPYRLAEQTKLREASAIALEGMFIASPPANFTANEVVQAQEDEKKAAVDSVAMRNALSLAKLSGGALMMTAGMIAAPIGAMLAPVVTPVGALGAMAGLIAGGYSIGCRFHTPLEQNAPPWLLHGSNFVRSGAVSTPEQAWGIMRALQKAKVVGGESVQGAYRVVNLYNLPKAFIALAEDKTVGLLEAQKAAATKVIRFSFMTSNAYEQLDRLTRQAEAASEAHAAAELQFQRGRLTEPQLRQLEAQKASCADACKVAEAHVGAQVEHACQAVLGQTVRYVPKRHGSFPQFLGLW